MNTALLSKEDKRYLDAIKDIVKVTFPQASGLAPQVYNHELSYCTVMFKNGAFYVNTAGMILGSDQVKPYVQKLHNMEAVARQLNRIYQKLNP